MSTPSDISQDQLYSNRRGSDTPDDYINSLGGALMHSAVKDINEKSKFLINSSLRVKNSFSDLQSSSYPSYSDTRLVNLQISPRINQKANAINKNISINFGVDLQVADYESLRKKNENAIALHEYDGTQKTISTFSQAKVFIDKSLSVGLGIRLQNNQI